jgi:hypothetical protein
MLHHDTFILSGSFWVILLRSAKGSAMVDPAALASGLIVSATFPPVAQVASVDGFVSGERWDRGTDEGSCG